ncbi:unnamed protein product [Victoria cruziana]
MTRKTGRESSKSLQVLETELMLKKVICQEDFTTVFNQSPEAAMKISLTLTHRKRLAFSNFKQHALASTTFSPSRTKENCP